MLAKTKQTKLEKELEEVNARVRNLTLAECNEAIECAEKAIKNVRAELRQHVTLEYNPHEVANSYGYHVEGTALYVEFNKSGKAVNASVSRDMVRDCKKFRLIIDHEAVGSFIENELGVKRPVRVIKEMQQYDLIRVIVLKESGFNHHGTMPL